MANKINKLELQILQSNDLLTFVEKKLTLYIFQEKTQYRGYDFCRSNLGDIFVQRISCDSIGFQRNILQFRFRIIDRCPAEGSFEIFQK